MSNASHPSPAEVCRERNWHGPIGGKPGTKIKDSHGSERIITHISDEDWIVTRLTDTAHLSIWGIVWDITDWVEVEPPPVVTVEKSIHDGDHHVVCVGGKDGFAFFAIADCVAIVALGIPACERITLAMAETGKAAIEAELNHIHAKAKSE